MIKTFITFSISICLFFANAQNSIDVSYSLNSKTDVVSTKNVKFKEGIVSKKNESKDVEIVFKASTIDKSTEQPFVAVVPFLPYNENNANIQFFVREFKDNLWLNWIEIEIDHHTADEIYGGVLHFVSFESDSFQLKILQLSLYSFLPENINLNVYYPGITPEILFSQKSRPKSGADCDCEIPSYLDRLGWCPIPFNCPAQTNPTFTNVTHLVVHHSAGTNTSNDWSAVVRAIWNYHTGTNNWADVGYNYLIDPNGVIYEGRGNNVVGAHFSGMNARTMGVCMLGNFQTSSPTQAMSDALTELLGWKACDIDALPTSSAIFAGNNTNLNVICGHRDSNNPATTLCPGDNLYPLLPSIRNNTEAYIENCELVEEPTPQNSDIVVISMQTTPISPVAGTQAVLNVRLRNVGTANITQPFGTSFRINSTEVANVTTNSLNSATSVDLTANYTFSSAGTYQYCVFAETAHNEMNGVNNSFCVNITVQAAPIVEDTTTVSISTLKEASVLVYPNPSSEQLYVSTDINFEFVQLYNTLGQQLVNETFVNKKPLEISSLPQGVYMLRLSSKNEVVERKILIER